MSDVVMIKDCKKINSNTRRISFEWDAETRPGQFIMVWAPGMEEIPLSLSGTKQEKSITFKYTGAKAGDNNWVGVYTKDASVTPDAQSETSSFYVYLADGDGEYTIEFDKCLYTRDNKDTYAPGSFWRNVENPVLADKQENYKLLWLGGASWYETLAQAALPAASQGGGDNPSTSDGALAVAIVAAAAAGAVVLAKKKH